MEFDNQLSLDSPAPVDYMTIPIQLQLPSPCQMSDPKPTTNFGYLPANALAVLKSEAKMLQASSLLFEALNLRSVEGLHWLQDVVHRPQD